MMDDPTVEAVVEVPCQPVTKLKVTTWEGGGGGGGRERGWGVVDIDVAAELKIPI